jgi:hypothetical protein
MSISRARLQITTRAGSNTRRVFVSYAHRDGPMAQDGDLPEAVYAALVMLAEGERDLGLARERIFFDRSGLSGGEDWAHRIKSEILQADLFLLLVSINALNSDYCMNKELPLAAAAGIPIIPVLLTECLWQGRPVPVAGGERALGSYDAVPKDANANHAPIKSPLWPDRETALTRTMQQIAKALRLHAQGSAEAAAPLVETVGAAQRPPAPPPHLAALPPYLPYLCNQDGAESEFRSFIHTQWEAGKLLLVLIKGSWEDHPEGFWKRLCKRTLHDFCETQRLSVLDPKPLRLPQAMDGTKLRPSLAEDVRAALSEALCGNMSRLKSGAEMAQALAMQSVLPLYATLPVQADEGNIALLGELVQLLESAPARSSLDHLVLAIQVTDELLWADGLLRQRLRLEQYRRTQVVELRQLEALQAEDVRLWHANYELVEYGIDLPDLHAALFTQQQALRMRRFDRAVRPLLPLSTSIGSR